MADYIATVRARLDDSELSRKIQSLENSEINLKNFIVNPTNITSEIQRALNSTTFTIDNINISNLNLGRQMQTQGQSAGQQFSRSFSAGMANISTDIGRTFTNTLERANKALRTGGLETSISGVQSRFDQLGYTGHERLTVIQQDITELTRLQNAMVHSASDDELVNSYNAFNDVLKRTQNNLKIVSNYTKTFATEAEVATLQGRIETWLTQNSRAKGAYGNQLNGYVNQLREMNATGNRSRSTLNEIAAGFRQVDVAAGAAGLKGKTFTDQFKTVFGTVTRYIGSARLIYAAIRSVRSGIKEVIDLDTALVDLQKTTSATKNELKEFYYSANDTAKELGQTTKDVIQAAADWSRLGYSLSDSKKMAEVSSIFTSISPDLDMDKATDGLVSAMKAFHIVADEALDGIASKINIIGKYVA